MNILQNKNLIIKSKNSGAELTRIYSKKLDKEILWCGDSNFWGRHSPILFPIVGRLKDNETNIEESLFNMNQHGFARDMDFVISDTSDDSITYTLVSNEDTKKLYPYAFELIIKYTLIENEVKIDWSVKNIDTREIYFSIGAHPAFNLNFKNSESLSDYYIHFNHGKDVEQILLSGPYSDNSIHVDILNNLDLNPELFANDALIYTNINSITLNSKNSDEFVKVSFDNFPLVGVWTPYYKDTNSTAPFLCIEPWHGLADSVDSDKVFKNKKYINNLLPNEIFNTSYSIIIG